MTGNRFRTDRWTGTQTPKRSRREGLRRKTEIPLARHQILQMLTEKERREERTKTGLTQPLDHRQIVKQADNRIE